MDKEKLRLKLDGFLKGCELRGKPLKNMCIDEAFPGDSSTSFILKVQADWIDHNESCSEVLDLLFDILWDTTDETIRKQVFSIQVLNNNEELHCEGERPKQEST